MLTAEQAAAGWQQAFSDGHPYYYNSVTGETTWEPPGNADAIVEGASAAPNDDPFSVEEWLAPVTVGITVTALPERLFSSLVHGYQQGIWSSADVPSLTGSQRLGKERLDEVLRFFASVRTDCAAAAKEQLFEADEMRLERWLIAKLGVPDSEVVDISAQHGQAEVRPATAPLGPAPRPMVPEPMTARQPSIEPAERAPGGEPKSTVEPMNTSQGSTTAHFGAWSTRMLQRYPQSGGVLTHCVGFFRRYPSCVIPLGLLCQWFVFLTDVFSGCNNVGTTDKTHPAYVEGQQICGYRFLLATAPTVWADLPPNCDAMVVAVGQNPLVCSKASSALLGIPMHWLCHKDLAHIGGNSVGFIVFGLMIIKRNGGLRRFFGVSLASELCSGLTWLTPRGVCGAAGMIYGYAGYLVTLGIFRIVGLPPLSQCKCGAPRRCCEGVLGCMGLWCSYRNWQCSRESLIDLAVSLVMIVVFGSIFGGILPWAVDEGTSWESHLFGLLAGCGYGAAIAYRMRKEWAARGDGRALTAECKQSGVGSSAQEHIVVDLLKDKVNEPVANPPKTAANAQLNVQLQQGSAAEGSPSNEQWTVAAARGWRVSLAPTQQGRRETNAGTAGRGLETSAL